MLVYLIMHKQTCSECRAAITTSLCPICGWEDGLAFDPCDEEVTTEEVSLMLRNRIVAEAVGTRRPCDVTLALWHGSSSARAWSPRQRSTSSRG